MRGISVYDYLKHVNDNRLASSDCPPPDAHSYESRLIRFIIPVLYNTEIL